MESCAPCGEPDGPMGATTVAVAVLIAVVIIYYLANWLAPLCFGSKDSFSARAKDVHDQSRELFERSGSEVSYSEYKTHIPGADPVLYTDVRRLWRGGQLSPESVEHVL